MNMEHSLEIAGTIVGLIYLWLEYRASIYLWIASIIMPAIYIVVYYNAGLYADFGISIYYLLAAIYGWIVWKYGTSLFPKFLCSKKKSDTYLSKQTIHISQTPLRYIPCMLIVFMLAFFTIASILIAFTDSDVPWWDSFTTALSIVAMWMLAHKYLEQWLIWIAVNVVSVGLYIYKDLYFTAGLYLLYAAIAVFGYLKWKKLMLKGNTQTDN